MMNEKLAIDAMHVAVERGSSFYYYGPEGQMQKFNEAIRSNWKTLEHKNELDYLWADCLGTFKEPFLDYRISGNFVIYRHDYDYWTMYCAHTKYAPGKYRQALELLDKNGEIADKMEILNEPGDDGMSEETYPKTCLRSERGDLYGAGN
jgi:hypothetical protein